MFGTGHVPALTDRVQTYNSSQSVIAYSLMCVLYWVVQVITFLNMIREMTAEAVKRAAMRIMIMPTGMLVFKPVRAEIQPLQSIKAYPH